MIDMVAFWLQNTLKSYCMENSLSLIPDGKDYGKFCHMPVDYLAVALYENYYQDILQSAEYEKGKLESWKKVLEEYKTAFQNFNQIKAKGIGYIISNMKQFKKAFNELKTKDVDFSFVDITEIALSRYVDEGKGDYQSFVKLMY